MQGINSVSILLMVTGLAILAWFLDSLRTIKKRRAQITQISSLPAEGRVKVIGKAEGGSLVSPVINSPCVLWQLEVKEFPRNKDEKYDWNPVSFLSSTEPFEIEDGSGKILIQPERTRLDLRHKTKIYYPEIQIIEIKDGSGKFLVPSTKTRPNLNDKRNILYTETQITEALEKIGVETTDSQGSKRELALYESILAPGEYVYVDGEIKQSERDKTVSSGNNPLVISELEKSQMNQPVMFETFLGVIIFLCYALILVCIITLLSPYKGHASIRMTNEEIMGYYIFLKYPLYIGLFSSIILWLHKFFMLKIISFSNKSPRNEFVISFGILSFLYLVISSTL